MAIYVDKSFQQGRESAHSPRPLFVRHFLIAQYVHGDSMFKSAFRVSPLKLLPLSLLLVGCATQRNGSQLPIPAGKHGMVHGGQQPVAGATIQLYAVGTTGDGAASTPLLSPAAVSDANGAFNITGTYTCPSSSSLVYIVANGGNPGLAAGTNNAALSLMAALGPCGNLTASTYIFVNEITTIAAVYPLAPFMTSSTAIGSSSTDAAALASAFTVASELVNTTIGAAPGTGVPTGTIVPVAQINTIGDFVAPCVDSAGGVSGDNSACGNLFALTTPTGFAAPTNSVTALQNLANNPTMNTASLYALVPAAAPFQPTDPETPADFSVRLTVPSGFTASTTVLNFPPTRIGVLSTSVPQAVTFTNNTATPIGIDIATLLTSSPTASGADPYDFRPANYINDQDACPTPVMPGATCTLQITFSPLAVGARSAYLTVFNTSANPYIYILLTGEGLEANSGPALISPGDLVFTAPGSPMSATLTNYGTLALTIDGISISNDPTSGQPAFTQTNNCGSSLAPQGTCTLTVSALSTPQIYSSGILSVGDDAAAGPQTLALSYSNGFTGAVLFNFGSRSVGTQGQEGVSVSVGGPGNYTLSLSGPDATDFSFLSGSSSQSSPCTISDLGPLCPVVLYFTPSAQGLRTATLNVNGTPSYGVIGIGLSAGLHFSTTSDSYNVVPVSSINFGVLVIGQTSRAQGFSIVNDGTVPITLNAPVLSGPNASDFTLASSNCTAALAPNAVCSLTYTASPTQPTNRSAIVTLSDSTGTAPQQTVSLTMLGENPPPVANPSTIAFAYTPVGSVSAPQSFTITSYNNDPVTVTVVDEQSVPFFLTQGSSCSRTPCQLSVAYAPTAAGNSDDNLVITDLFSGEAGGVSLSGNDTPPPPPPPTTTIRIAPGSITFPAQSVGTTSTTGQGVAITNSGNQPLIVSQISLTGANPSDFDILGFCPSSVPVGAYCTFTVTFTPTATGTRTANVQIISNSSTSPDLIPITGTGQ
jgi:trimeric autotransporter adhesin